MQAGVTHSALGSDGCSAGGGGETAPAGTLAERKAFPSHFGRQSLPLRDRHPFEILCLACLASSHLCVERGLQKLPAPRQPGWLLRHGLRRDPAQVARTRRQFSCAGGMSPVKLLPEGHISGKAGNAVRRAGD